MLLIAISILLPPAGPWGYLHELLKELGIVILAVFTVSLLYEKLAAKRHLQEVRAELRGLLQEGENNAAACAQLGIREIFPNREVYERKYPIAGWTSKLGNKSTFRVVAQTMFHLMTKIDAVKMAIDRGAQVELCITNPDNHSHLSLLEQFGPQVAEIQATVSVFKKQIEEWVNQTNPRGKVELRYHRLPLIDSYLFIKSTNLNVVVWDLSFGRALEEKRIFLVDPNVRLGLDLTVRYGRIWDDSAGSTAFKYEGMTASEQSEEKTVKGKAGKEQGA
jgi:hypothetical protein